MFHVTDLDSVTSNESGVVPELPSSTEASLIEIEGNTGPLTLSQSASTVSFASDVATLPALELVRARAADQGVVPRAADQRVVSAQPVQLVVARLAVQVVGLRGAANDFVLRRSDYRRRQR